MNTIFENVLNFKSENVGDVYIINLNIKEFSDRFNHPIVYVKTNVPTSAFEPEDLAIEVNFVGSVEYNKGNLILKGEPVILDGNVKLQRQIHPETCVIIRIYDNLNDDQAKDLLKPQRILKWNEEKKKEVEQAKFLVVCPLCKGSNVEVTAELNRYLDGYQDGSINIDVECNDCGHKGFINNLS